GTSGARPAALSDGLEPLAAGCRFDDCRHRTEPGCAVLQALEDGRLPAERFAAWEKLQRELAWAGRRADPPARAPPPPRPRVGPPGGRRAGPRPGRAQPLSNRIPITMVTVEPVPTVLPGGGFW